MSSSWGPGALRSPRWQEGASFGRRTRGPRRGPPV